MKILLSCVRPSVLMLLLLLSICTFSDCYDPLDPNGNSTVTFDIHDLRSDGYVARLVIADLMPDAPPVIMSENCCRGGLISAWAIDPLGSFSSFEMTVVSLDGNSTVYPPANLTLLAPDPGYTCGPVVETTPTVSSDLGGRRRVQVYNEVALFWGLQAYSDELLQPDQRQLGSVSTGILFEKDSGIFILRNGWALPRRIYSGGEECAMPLSDSFPALPNGSSCTKPPRYLFLLLLIYMAFKSQASWL